MCRCIVRTWRLSPSAGGCREPGRLSSMLAVKTTVMRPMFCNDDPHGPFRMHIVHFAVAESF